MDDLLSTQGRDKAIRYDAHMSLLHQLIVIYVLEKSFAMTLWLLIIEYATVSNLYKISD